MSRKLRLRLYIAGTGSYSTRTQQNLENAAAAAGIDYDLELVDLRREPGRSAADGVLVTPTLVRLTPPRAMLIGDLSDLPKVKAVLGSR